MTTKKPVIQERISEPVRYEQLDFLRAAAILCVLIIHTVSRYPAANRLQEILTQHLLIWSNCTIAIFLFISGCLFKTDRPDRRYLFRRYRRILGPYLFFSAAAVTYQILWGQLEWSASSIVTVAVRLVLGGSWQVYYFVFVIFIMYTFGYLIFSHPRLGKYLPHLTAILLIVNLLHGAFYQTVIHRFNIADHTMVSLYQNRFLLLWPVYFFGGILFRRYDGFARINQHKNLIRTWWILVFVSVNLVLYYGKPNISCHCNSPVGTLYAWTTILFLLTFNIRHPAIIFVSDKTYYLYLAHIFFVYGWVDISRHFQMEWPYWTNYVILLIALVGPILLYFPLKLLLKDKSRLIIGT